MGRPSGARAPATRRGDHVLMNARRSWPLLVALFPSPSFAQAIASGGTKTPLLWLWVALGLALLAVMLLLLFMAQPRKRARAHLAERARRHVQERI